jgi:hypothetical protein
MMPAPLQSLALPPALVVACLQENPYACMRHFTVIHRPEGI